mmetsp:Transcript_33030/g.60559  ORF Transcript_33030/g.60559 Transcript_33030/m.60559 type:complete len:647 (+) Transcript_33030:79-2019(+)
MAVAALQLEQEPIEALNVPAMQPSEEGDQKSEVEQDLEEQPRRGSHQSEATVTSCSSFQKCVVCYVNPCDAKLQPCGHDLFCKGCAARFRTCPLCRAPLTLRNGRAHLPDADTTIEELRNEREAAEATNQGLSANFLWWARTIGILFWLFIFMGGAIEWVHGVPADGCPPQQRSSGWQGLSEEQRRRYLHCRDCSWNGHCNLCAEGTINGGFQCFDNVDDLPPVRAGAALGGSTYLVLIILVQVAGGSSECGLIYWCRKRDLLQEKELVILALALIIEVLRMLLVDIFLLQHYFSGMSYKVYRAPVPCGPGLLFGNNTFFGDDGVRYCVDASPPHEDTAYYIAVSQEAFGAKCPTYTTASALLDYGRTPGPLFFKGGHPRYSHLGWVIGGEFAMFYLFATFVNEVADNMFVMPTTTSYGVFCKAFSVALELFQLGALCPAAIFVHGDCLEYTNPMGVSLHLIRDVVVWFGYCVWGLLLFSAPLALGGMVLTLFLTCMSGATCLVLSVPIQCCCGSEVAARFHSFRLSVMQKVWWVWDGYVASTHSIVNLCMMVAFAPLLLVGMFLGSLVVAGQLSKQDTMQIITALVLLSDVLFKIVATIATELFDFLLHMRVARAVRGRQRSNHVGATVLGRPEREPPLEISSIE